MALDPNIILGITPPESPIKSVSQVFALKNMQDEQKIRAMELQQKQDEITATHTLDQAMKGASSDEDLRDRIINAGIGHKWPAIAKQLGDAHKVAAEIQELQGKAAEKRADYWGSLAAGVQHLPPEMRGTGLVDALRLAVNQHGMLKPEEAQQFIQQIMQNPDQLDALLEARVQASPAQRKVRAEETTARARELTSKLAAARNPFEIEKLNEEVKKLQGLDPKTAAEIEELQARKANEVLRGPLIRAQTGAAAAEIPLRNAETAKAAAGAAKEQEEVNASRMFGQGSGGAAASWTPGQRVTLRNGKSGIFRGYGPDGKAQIEVE
jgi:hypothetical protein